MANFRLKDFFNEIFEKLSIPSLIRIREILEKAVFEIGNKVIENTHQKQPSGRVL